ncbi:MAG: DNA-3-methyladenine glycosylase 2 family protein [Armatimonadetes bacterium]|nr:DNA-3-methyladenine glycosylase 2 family protein [Armatimonadota bacterium]
MSAILPGTRAHPEGLAAVVDRSPRFGYDGLVMSASRHAEAEAHLAAADPTIAALVAAHGACTLAPEPRHFFALVRAVLGQQISVKAAASIRGRLAARLPGGEVTPEGILAMDEEQLRAAGLSRPKARCVRDLAGRVSSGALDLAWLARQPDEVVVVELTLVKGIGRWTAEMFLIFSLGRPDVLATSDLGFRAAVKRAYRLGALPDEPQLREIAAPWHPYASIATWHLWRSLDNLPAAR